MEAKGSKGITVVGFFLILISIYLFITAWSFIVSSVVIEDELFLTILALRQSLFPIDIWNPDMETLRRIIRISAILRLVHSLFLFVVAIGLLKLKNWARILLIGYCALWSLVYLAPTIHVRTIDAQTIIYLLKVIPFLMVYTILIFFATRPKVKEQFKFAQAGEIEKTIQGGINEESGL